MQRQIKSIAEQKLLEQRRRQTAYSFINKSLGLTSMFDFFSHDAFTIVLKAKLFAQKYKAKLVHNEMLLFGATSVDLSMAKILQCHNIDKETLKKFYLQHENENENENEPICILQEATYLCDKKSAERTGSAYILNKVLKFAKNFLVNMEAVLLNKKEQQISPKFSEACLFLFEHAAKNAQKQFHTPVISADILVFTMMEEKQLKIGQLFLSTLKSQLEWLMLRYKLIKRIYAQEVGVRQQLKTKHFYYLYLLKTQIAENKYDAICKNESLEHRALVLRTLLIKQALKTNLVKWTTALITHRLNKRIYSIY